MSSPATPPRRARTGLLCACLAALFAARAAPAQPTIEWVTPTARTGGGTVIVLLKNGEKPVENVTLTWLSREGAVVPFGAEAVPALEAKGETAVTGRAPAELAVAPGDSLLLRVAFRSGTATQSRFAWLPVARRRGPPPLQVVVLGTTQSLVDYETRRILLQLTDTGAVPLRVDSIRTRWPASIAVHAVTHLGEPAGFPLQLAPGETRVVAYDVRLAGGITPGQQTLVFDVPVSWRAGGETVTGNAVASTPLTLAVLGESELLKVLTLPSLLFVPGFLILVMLGLLWRVEAFARWRPRLTLPSKPVEPEFWVISITASMAVWLVVRLLWKRNVLAAYNARDVASIWLGSLAAGIAIFLAVVAVYRVWQNWQRSPMRVLDSLANRERTLVLPRVRFTVGDREGTGFLLRDDDPAAPTVLVVPPLRIGWTEGLDERIRRCYEAKLAPRELDARDVAEVLKRAQRKGHAKVFWKQSRAIAWPVLIARADLREDGRDLLLQVERAKPSPARAPAPAPPPPAPPAPPGPPAAAPPAAPPAPAGAPAGAPNAGRAAVGAGGG
ncbi:MAG TPA: hypothetical protein VF006_33950 [Longimicrobium sp.]